MKTHLFGATAIVALLAFTFSACNGKVARRGGESEETVGLPDDYVDHEDDSDYPSACLECACTYLSSDDPEGCADVCDNTISGSGSPNFCNGVTALAQCAQCIEERCGYPPDYCN